MKRWIRSFTPALALAVVVAAGVAAVGNGPANAQTRQQPAAKASQQTTPPTATPATETPGTEQPDASEAQGTEQPEANEPQGAEQPDANEAAEAAALAGKAKITAQQAEQTALAANSGATVVKTKLDDENGTVVYSVELSTGADVKVDAQSGVIASTYQEANESNGDGEHEDGTQDLTTQAAPAQ